VRRVGVEDALSGSTTERRGHVDCPVSDDARREEAWQVAGVHGADITGASVLRTEEEPQDSNDFRWVLRRQARSCQRCGHRAAQE